MIKDIKWVKVYRPYKLLGLVEVKRDIGYTLVYKLDDKDEYEFLDTLNKSVEDEDHVVFKCNEVISA